MKIPTRERDALKRHDMRAAKQRAQARLNRAAVAFCAPRPYFVASVYEDKEAELYAAVRAFQKFNATPTKGKK